MATSIVLILGAGQGIGAQVAAQFAAQGYKIATAARSLENQRRDDQHLSIKLDLTKSQGVPDAFRRVKEHFGAPPSIVIYNAARVTNVPADDPLGFLSMDEYMLDLAVNLDSAVVAAKEAVIGFASLPDSAARTFIYTGNKLNVMSSPRVFSFGISKTGAAHFIWDCSVAYKDQGFRFHFVDERLDDGAPARDLMDPRARAEHYLLLCTSGERLPWHYTFVKSKGYIDFRSVDQAWKVES